MATKQKNLWPGGATDTKGVLRVWKKVHHLNSENGRKLSENSWFKLVLL